MEMEVEGKSGSYRLVLGCTPARPAERQEVECEFKVVQVLAVPDPLLGSQLPLLDQQLMVRFKSLDNGNFVSDLLEPSAGAEDGTYMIHHALRQAGPYSLIVYIDEEGDVLEAEFPFQIRDNPYDAWARVVINGLLALLLVPFAVIIAGRREAFIAGRFRMVTTVSSLFWVGFFVVTNVLLVDRVSAAILDRAAPQHGSIELIFRSESGPAVFEVSQDLIESFDIQTVLVDEQEFRSVLNAKGKIVAKPELSSQVSAPLWGRIELAHGPLTVGDYVRRGQPLVNVVLELNSTERKDLMDRFEDIRSAKEQAVHRVQATEAALASVISLGEEKIVPREEVGWARQRNESAQEEMRVLEKQFDQYLKVMKWRDPRSTPVIAAIDGFITDINFIPGELNSEGETRRLLTIVDLSEVWIEAEIAEGDLDQLSNIRSARIRTEAYPAEEHRARLQAISPWVDEKTRRLKVVFEIKNPENKLKLGMWADVMVESGRLGKSAAVHRSALLEDGEQSTIYVTDGQGLFERRLVEVGVRKNDQVQIKKGVRPGELVVVNGFYQLRALHQNLGQVPSDSH
jgi:RND family efflux transporter MFP subunit